jgi:hypothetical protein
MSAEGERVDAEAVSIEQWINGHIEGAGDGCVDIGCALNFERNLFDAKRARGYSHFLHFSHGI